MKFLVLCLTVCAVSAFAVVPSELGALNPEGVTPGGTDDVVFNQTYVFANLLNGLRHTAMADDFILSANASIQNIRFWIVHSGSTSPTSYDMAFSQDAGDSDPNNATNVWSETITVVLFDTGDTSWGFPIYEVTCPIASYPSLVAGQRYWLEITFNDSSVNDYWLVQNPIWGSYPWTRGTSWARVDTWTDPCDSFFDLYDSPVPLERETWGSIKSIF